LPNFAIFLANIAKFCYFTFQRCKQRHCKTLTALFRFLHTEH
jgi:hypothetical protein